MKKILDEYCVGCGLCDAFGKAQCKEDKNGFLHPKIGDEEWLTCVCPAGGRQQELMDFSNIWGRTKMVYYGWSTDAFVRKTASSGGVLTEVASWMLENDKVDGVVHTCADPKNPTATVSCISTTREELVSRSGSRYAISHPLSILASLDKTKQYAFIGKPCDVAALKNYMKIEPEWENIIIFTLSFFCAGLPSKTAQEKLLEHLGCPKEELKTLRYRGDGWPGFTSAVEQSGVEHRTDYGTSWGKILGRDIMKMCRFCLDGIGETADISCGDAWYLTDDKKPDFSEADGRNVIFARTAEGKEILDAVVADAKICVEPAEVGDLEHIQTYQCERRATMVDKYAGMKLMGRSFPRYKLSNVRKFGKSAPVKRHLKVYFGIVKRVLIGKI